MHNLESHKKTIAVIAAAFILGVSYWGNYLPLRKSQAFIQAVRTTGSARTLEEFTAIMSVPLDSPSPIGQPELVRNMANTVTNVLRGQAGRDPRLVEALVGYVNHYYQPLLSQPRGMSFGQDLYILGFMNQVAFAQTGDPKYLEQAREHFGMAHRLAPRRPQPLYGLLDLARLAGDRAEAERISGIILGYWPEDPLVRQVLDSLNRTSTPSAPAP
jgi:hypothetical protein